MGNATVLGRCIRHLAESSARIFYGVWSKGAEAWKPLDWPTARTELVPVVPLGTENMALPLPEVLTNTDVSNVPA